MYTGYSFLLFVLLCGSGENACISGIYSKLYVADYVRCFCLHYFKRKADNEKIVAILVSFLGVGYSPRKRKYSKNFKPCIHNIIFITCVDSSYFKRANNDKFSIRTSDYCCGNIYSAKR